MMAESKGKKSTVHIPRATEQDRPMNTQKTLHIQCLSQGWTELADPDQINS